MVRYAICFFITLGLFLALDFTWISLFGGPMFQTTLGPVMAEPLRVAPMFIFYAMYIIGIMVFVVPKEEGWQSLGQTFLFGALYGMVTYGTFDLTNLAVIQAYSPNLAFVDLLWGIVGTAVTATVATFATDWIMTHLIMS